MRLVVGKFTATATAIISRERKNQQNRRWTVDSGQLIEVKSYSIIKTIYMLTDTDTDTYKWKECTRAREKRKALRWKTSTEQKREERKKRY